MRVRVLSPALDEITEAALWFDTQRRGLGQAFWRSVDETLARIEQNPLQFGRSEFATDRFEFRCAVVRQFNYIVHFVVDADEVQIASVAHAARRLGYWLRRVRK